MEKEIKDLLNQVLANQAVIFHRLEVLYQKQIKNTEKSFYDEKRAQSDLSDIADKLP